MSSVNIRQHTPRVIAGVVVLAGLAAGLAINSMFPTTEEVLERPFDHQVTVGETASLRTMDLTVTDVSTAEVVSEYLSEYQTNGVWVVLDIDITAKDAPITASGFTLVAESGNVYGGFADVLTGCGTLQPGIRTQCQTVFEVHPDDAGTMTLRVPAAGVEGDTSDDLAVVALEVPADTPVPLLEIARQTFGGAS